jgi:ribose transport system substrate-binding protein
MVRPVRRRDALALSLPALLAGCQRRARKVIAVIPKAVAHPFWVMVEAGARAAGRDRNVEILWNGAASETDYSRQVQIVDAMIARRVDGIVLAATERNALAPPVDRAAAAGIPVAIFDSGLDSDNYMTFVATNNYEAGRMGGRKLAELLGGKGTVAMVLHATGSLSTIERERGFEDAIGKEFPGIRIVARQYGMADRARARAVTENFLAAHPDLDGIFCSTEPSATGASLALKSRALAGKVKFVGFDWADLMIADLRQGVLHATVAQDPYRIGYEAVRAVADKLNGRTPPKRIDLNARVITREDLDKPEVKQLLFPDPGKAAR